MVRYDTEWYWLLSPPPQNQRCILYQYKNKINTLCLHSFAISYPVATECAMWAKQIVLPTCCWYWWSWSVIVVSYFPSRALTLASFPGSPGTRICIHVESLIHVSFLIWAWHNPKRTRVFRAEKQCFCILFNRLSVQHSVCMIFDLQ